MNNNIDDKLIKAYVGSGYEKFTSKKFNFYAFWLGPFYVVGKKLYTLGSVLMITAFPIAIASRFVENEKLANTLFFVVYWIPVMTFLGLKFNYIYINYVKKNIEKIKAENTNATESQLGEICAQKGKPSILGFIIFFIAVGAFAAILRTVLGL